MPMLNFNLKETWDALYSPSFERQHMYRIFGEGLRDATSLRVALEEVGMNSGQSIVIMGGGFGWSAEEWMASGYTKLVVCDSSGYIQDNKSQHAVVDVLNEDALTEASISRIKAALDNEPIDWVVTEDVLPCLTDAELPLFFSVCRSLGASVAHWVSPLVMGSVGDTLNWKTLEDWKQLAAPDYIVPRGSNAVA